MPEGAASLLPPFVGRERELAALLSRCRAERAFVVVEGSAGIGKTRLLAELLAHPAVGASFSGRGQHGPGGFAYRPWRMVADAARSVLDPAGAEPPMRAADRIAALLDGREAERQRGARSDPLDPVEPMAMALAEYLTRLGEALSEPALVAIDDLHLADPESLELLSWLLGERVPVRVVAASRPVAEAPDAVTERLAALFDEAELLRLGPLTAEELSELLAASAAELVDEVPTVAAMTGGVPLVVRDLIVAARTGGLAGAGRELLERRLALLAQPVQALVDAVAVIGDDVDPVLLVEVCDLDADDVGKLLAAAAAAGVLECADAARWAFHHPTYRDGVYARLTTDRRTALHAAVLAALRARDPGVSVAVLAEHAAAAGPHVAHDRAIELDRRAAEQALRDGAPTAAVRHYERALDRASTAGLETTGTAPLLLGLGRAQRLAGSPAASDSLLKALQAARSSGDAVLLAEAALAYPPNSGSLGLDAHGDALAEAWLELAERRLGAGHPALRARVRLELALQRHHRLTDEVLLDVVREATEVARRVDDEELAALAFVTAHGSRHHLGEPDDSVAEARRSLVQLDPSAVELWLALHGVVVVQLLRRGAFREARSAIEQLAPAARWSRATAWNLGRWRTALALATGAFAEAEQGMAEVYRIVAGTRHEPAAVDHLAIQSGELLRGRHDPATAVPAVRAWVSERPDVPGYRAALAWVLAELGEAAEGREELAVVVRSLEGEVHDLTWLPTAAMAGLAAAGLGAAETAGRCARWLAPHLDDWVVVASGTVVLGPVALFAGAATEAAGDVAGGVELLRRARTAARAAGARPAAAQAGLVLADALERAGDRDGAAGIRRQVAGELAALGVAVGDAARPARRAPAAPEPPVTGRWVRQGAVWQVGIGDEDATLPDRKGLAIIGVLLERPGDEVHVLELSAAAAGHPGDATAAAPRSEQPVLDDRSVRAFRSRIGDLEAVIAEARAANDLDRAALAQAELDHVVAELARSTGLAGRSRSLDRTVERARVRVTKAVRRALAELRAVAPATASHLETTIQTGTFCAYRPETGHLVAWGGGDPGETGP